MDAGNWLTVVSIVGSTITAILVYVLTQKNKKIELLEQKNELLDKANRKLDLQVLKLELTGQAATKFFQQLPNIKPNDEEVL